MRFTCLLFWLRVCVSELMKLYIDVVVNARTQHGGDDDAAKIQNGGVSIRILRAVFATKKPLNCTKFYSKRKLRCEHAARGENCNQNATLLRLERIF